MPLTSPRSCCARVMSGDMRREYRTVSTAIAGKTTEPTSASTGSVTNSRPSVVTSMRIDADGEGERRDRVPGRLDVAVGVGQQLAGRVVLVPGQRQLEVAPGDAPAVGGLQPVLHDPGAEAAGDDADDLEGRRRA